MTKLSLKPALGYHFFRFLTDLWTFVNFSFLKVAIARRLVIANILKNKLPVNFWRGEIAIQCSADMTVLSIFLNSFVKFNNTYASMKYIAYRENMLLQ